MKVVMIDTRSKEYVEWMASVWKANDERNQKDERHLQIKEERRISELFRKRIREDDGK